jgi:phosphopantothenoylcysteine synthetase/decarboxylase
VSSRAALYVVAASAPPVRQMVEACRLALDAGWQPFVTLTPTAADWVDVDELRSVTGQPVRVQARRPSESDPFPPADAVLAAPLTFNTINKWAYGINDTVALGLLNELLGSEVPIVAAPCVKAVLRAHPAYAANVRLLEGAGVQFLSDSSTARGDDGLAAFDWPTVVQHLSRIARAARSA